MQIVTREDGRVVACAQSGLLGGVEAPVPGAWAGGMAGINPLDWRLDNGTLVYDPLPEPADPLADLAELVIDLTVGLEEVKLQQMMGGENDV